MLSVVSGAVLLGFQYALLALGVYISFRILNIPDLTVDGSFTFGTRGGATNANLRNAKIANVSIHAPHEGERRRALNAYAKARKMGYDVSVLVFHFDFLALDGFLGGIHYVASKLFDAE